MRLNKGVDRRGAGYPNSEMIFKIEPTDNVLLWPIPKLNSNQPSVERRPKYSGKLNPLQNNK